MAQAVLESYVALRSPNVVVNRSRGVGARLHLSFDGLVPKAPFRSEREDVVQALLSSTVFPGPGTVSACLVQVYALLKVLDLRGLGSGQVVHGLSARVVGVWPGRGKRIHVREVARKIVSSR